MAVGDEAVSLLALLRLPRVGARRVKILADAFGSGRAAVAASAAARAEALGVRRLDGRVDLDAAAADLRSWGRLGVTVLPLGGRGYPAALGEIYDPPPLLYLQGTMAALTGRRLAIVGSRDCTQWGAALALDLARGLATSGVVVVSGLALGIDASAHRGALRHGPTVAVLGSSVTEVAPRRHQRLADDILATGGAVLSEYPPGTKTVARHFVERNRIVSGLSSGVVVVEAGLRSGALHTCDFALDQGRAVMAVPGRPSDATSAGTLALLRDGATPVGSVAHILDELGWPSIDAASAGPDNAGGEAPLVGAAAMLIAELKRRGPSTLDTLQAALALSAAELRADLGHLELRGTVRRTGAGRYALAASASGGRDR